MISFTNNSYLTSEPYKNDVCKQAAFFVHSPFEIPLSVRYQSFTKIYFGALVEILITPEVIRTDESIMSMELEHRKCYAQDEFKLKYFTRYTKSHCESEVLSEMTFEHCGCVPFNYIRNKTMNVCSLLRWKCAF